MPWMTSYSRSSNRYKTTYKVSLDAADMTDYLRQPNLGQFSHNTIHAYIHMSKVTMYSIVYTVTIHTNKLCYAAVYIHIRSMKYFIAFNDSL